MNGIEGNAVRDRQPGCSHLAFRRSNCQACQTHRVVQMGGHGSFPLLDWHGFLPKRSCPGAEMLGKIPGAKKGSAQIFLAGIGHQGKTPDTWACSGPLANVQPTMIIAFSWQITTPSRGCRTLLNEHVLVNCLCHRSRSLVYLLVCARSSSPQHAASN